ncbi:MAG: tRNA (cytidine(34)-2'-O)-methyltransferase [Verrucomicrobia bacterium]|nr:MAG: tRNA (cytidine(34)-2'-O)-methyltransferase [Verrucomicrobiota bacterium]
MFNVVLIEPEIPPNTGNIGRLCLATRSTLHLVKPLGFSLEDRQLKRAGLDYWDEVNVQLWESFDALRGAQPEARYFFLTTKTKRAYYEARFRQGDFLVFGRETKGLPENLLSANIDSCVRIPMYGTRSLNLATAVAIVLFEAVRQQRWHKKPLDQRLRFVGQPGHPKRDAGTLNK